MSEDEEARRKHEMDPDGLFDDVENLDRLREELGSAVTFLGVGDDVDFERMPEQMRVRFEKLQSMALFSQISGGLDEVNGSCEKCEKLTAVNVAFIGAPRDEEERARFERDAKAGSRAMAFIASSFCQYRMVCAVCQIWLLERAKNIDDATDSERAQRRMGN
jgi:hypothetical protein